MDCNKEEALRAKMIAENKMQGRDFFGARKLVLKAQRLFPDLENISQMLTVCEVHCSAGNKINGETDWYSILQVESTSDGLTIKKQYRRLALLLHPDKNKFAGAEAAFQLVGEAHRTLSDQTKRSLHDMKRGTIFKTVSLRQPTQPPRTSPIRRKPGASANNASKPTPQFNGSNQPPSSSAQTFWTICTFCGIRYQYYLNIRNKTLRCQKCMKAFVAYDLNEHAVPSRANSSYPLNPTGVPQPELHRTGAYMGFQGGVSEPSEGKTDLGGGSKSKATNGCKVDDKEVRSESKVKFEKVKLKEVKKRESAVKSSEESKSKTGDGCKVDEKEVGVNFEKVQHHEFKKRESVAKSSGNARQKRKMVAESSDSEDIVIEAGRSTEKNAGSFPRRSTRQKQNVIYTEDETGVNDFAGPCEGNQNDEASCEGGFKVADSEADFPANKKEGTEKGTPSEEKLSNGTPKWEMAGEGEESLANGSGSKVNPSVSSDPTDMDSISYSDPEFFEFGKERDQDKFEVDQIWAVYDDFDGMPRFYARIRNVIVAPNFKLRYTWLEHDPAEMELSEYDLSPACGNFRLGKWVNTNEHLLFSHLMIVGKGKKKNTYEICPKKGEVWALFKDWDIGRISCEGDHRLVEYEAVEILSEYASSRALTAVRLVKINGFVSLFMRASDTVEIQGSQMCRFSHKIPSYRMNGKEREGIPIGSFELDTAALPANFAKTCPSLCLQTTKVVVEQDSGNVWPCEPARGDKAYEKEKNKASVQTETMTDEHQVNGNDEGPKKGGCTYLNDSGPTYEYSGAQFHNFAEWRSEGKFERGQIWALYSDIDKYPNVYGRIKSVFTKVFKVHVKWLEVCPGEENLLPISCGSFKIDSDTMVSHSTDIFSHLVQAVPTGRDHYAIYPSAGEVWALYKNWNAGWELSDLAKCDHDMVEIVARSDSGTKVSVLNKVDGYRTVFMAAGLTMEIPARECRRFSHQIPAFRLTDENGGQLRGYWELDPAAVPDKLIKG